MNSHTRLSAKGQLVLPKAVRDRLQWPPGTELEVVEHGGSVTLRAVPRPQGDRSAAEILADIRARFPYTGPRISDADIDSAVREAAVRADDASRE
jgi:AbrB family looped-hinge helix DNA binding protein